MCRVRHPPFLSAPAAFSIPSRLLSPFTPSEGVGVSRIFLTPSEGVGHTCVFLTPLEGVELLRCLYRRCESVIRFLTILTPSEGVGHTRVFLTPSEGVELLRCLYVRCAPVFHFRQNLSGTCKV